MELLMALIAAAGFRLRGDSWLSTVVPGWGTVHGRVLYAVSLGVPAALIYGLDWLYMPAFALALFLGSVIGWWESLDMGTDTGSLWNDMLKHSLRGIVWTVPAGLVLAILDPLSAVLFAIGGCLAGVFYALAMLVPWRIFAGPVALSQPDARGVNTPLGEILFGGWIGFSLAWSLS